MRNQRLIRLIAGVCAAIGSVSLVYSDDPIPSPPSSPPTTPAPAKPNDADKPKDAKPKDESGKGGAAEAPKWPGAPKKELYAQHDLRGKSAPAFKVQEWLTKEPDRKDRVVLIDFWATWCGPCRRLIPELNAWQKQFKNDLVVIGVSDEPKTKVVPFMSKNTVEYAMAIDQFKTMKNAIGISGIPHVLVVSSDGIVRWQGFPQSDEEELTTALLEQIIKADKAMRAAKDKPKEADGKGDKKPEGATPAAPTTPASPDKPAAK
jgi:thiol-disulfide isomerase/thioredoxin